MKSKNIIITGVSTGIGYYLAKCFTEYGYQVYGSVRKNEDAKKLIDEFGDLYSPLFFDITDGEAIKQEAERISKELNKGGLACLINNAGIAVPGPLLHLDIDDLKHQFEVNFFGMLNVIKAFSHHLGAKDEHPFDPGRILQISSVAGKLGMPFMGPYAASKHAMEGVSQSLRRELLLYGIKVIVMGPGPVKTPIWNKSATSGVEKFQDTPYQRPIKKFKNIFVTNAVKNGLEPDKLAKDIYEVFRASNPKNRYTFTNQKIKNWYLPMILPSKILDKVLGKGLGLLK